MGSSRNERSPAFRRQLALGGVAMAAAALMAPQAQAAEGGSSIYLLGSGGPGAAILPPVEGVFFANTLYYYNGSAAAGREFVVGGNVVAGLEATIVADFPAMLGFRPPTYWVGRWRWAPPFRSASRRSTSRRC